MTNKPTEGWHFCMQWSWDLEALPDFAPIVDNRGLAEAFRYLAAVLRDNLDDDEVLRLVRPLVVGMSEKPDKKTARGAAIVLADIDARLTLPTHTP